MRYTERDHQVAAACLDRIAARFTVQAAAYRQGFRIKSRRARAEPDALAHFTQALTGGELDQDASVSQFLDSLVVHNDGFD